MSPVTPFSLDPIIKHNVSSSGTYHTSFFYYSPPHKRISIPDRITQDPFLMSSSWPISSQLKTHTHVLHLGLTSLSSSSASNKHIIRCKSAFNLILIPSIDFSKQLSPHVVSRGRQKDQVSENKLYPCLCTSLPCCLQSLLLTCKARVICGGPVPPGGRR